MNILYICPQFLPTLGGIVSHVYNISKRMKDKYNHDVTIFTSDFNKELSPIEVIDGLKIKRFRFPAPVGPRWFWSYLAIPKLLQSLKENSFDIIHVHSYTNFGPLAICLSKKLNSNVNETPLIFTPHYHPESTTFTRNMLRRPYDFLLKNRIFGIFSKIIVLTNFEKQMLSDFCNESKIVVIPNGVDLDEINNAPVNLFRREYGLGENVRYVLYVGYLLEYKGVQVLLQVMKKVLDNNENIKVVIIGDGDYRSELQNLSVELGIDINTLFTGFIDRKLLLSAMKGCDVFVLPSEYEAFGIVLLEAMACGKPVIATNVGGIPDIGIDRDFLIDYGDVDTLLTLICYILNDPEIARRTGLRNYEVAKEYSWNKVAEDYEKVYEVSKEGR